MRRALVVLLILSLSGGQVGMVGLLLLGRHQARQHMYRRIATASPSIGENNTLRHLVIPRTPNPQSEASFIQLSEREFRYRGRLYDIVHEEQRGDAWHVWALRDRQEERYLEALARTLGTSKAFARPTGSDSQLPQVYWEPRWVSPAGRSVPRPAVRSRGLPRFHPGVPQEPSLEVPHPPPWG